MNRQTYWTYQVAGWSVFAAIGLVINIINGGYLPGLIVGHVLLVFYGIGLTHLLRHFVLSRETQGIWDAFAKSLSGPQAFWLSAHC